jgi:NAD(P)-dependent dehydrogenase (short-subunit alcohol dehydrogenase family)
MSKAATAVMTDTLRLEIAPFGIKIIALKTGTVKSKFYESRTPGGGVEFGRRRCDIALPFWRVSSG